MPLHRRRETKQIKTPFGIFSARERAGYLTSTRTRVRIVRRVPTVRPSRYGVIHKGVQPGAENGVEAAGQAAQELRQGGAVQVEHISLTPRVESAWFQLVESKVLSTFWFQLCQPAPLQPGPAVADAVEG